MRDFIFVSRTILVTILFLSAVCLNEAKDVSSYSNNTAIVWFPRIDTAILATSQNVDFIPNLTAYQQTTDYTCGPAALLSLAKFYGLPNISENVETEMQIAQECGTRNLNSSQPGTKPEEMVDWLENNGFNVQLEFEDKGDGTELQRLRDNIRNGTPTLVEWIDLSGHWDIAVGYDYRNESDPWDDVLILADPYDKYDDYSDGYSFVNANRFYWMWFDALYFDNITWRTMITATPKKALMQKPESKKI
jgi:hypothetical protein